MKKQLNTTDTALFSDAAATVLAIMAGIAWSVALVCVLVGSLIV